MKILTAKEKDGHPFWNRNEYTLMLEDTETGTKEDITYKVLKRSDGIPNPCHEFYFSEKGVEAQFFYCGSGYGKSPDGERFVALPRSAYDKLVIIKSKQKRQAERNYQGNWQDNSDFKQ